MKKTRPRTLPTFSKVFFFLEGIVFFFFIPGFLFLFVVPSSPPGHGTHIYCCHVIFSWHQSTPFGRYIWYDIYGVTTSRGFDHTYLSGGRSGHHRQCFLFFFLSPISVLFCGDLPCFSLFILSVASRKKNKGSEPPPIPSCNDIMIYICETKFYSLLPAIESRFRFFFFFCRRQVHAYLKGGNFLGGWGRRPHQKVSHVDDSWAVRPPHPTQYGCIFPVHSKMYTAAYLPLIVLCIDHLFFF